MGVEEGPKDPMTEMAVSAAALHEMFVSYQDAGFTHDEALELAKVTVATMSQMAFMAANQTGAGQ